MQKDTPTQLSAMTRHLHWSMAALMLTLMAVGWYMAENKIYALYGTHKSIGALVLVLALWRVVWRLMNGWPQHTGPQDWQHTLARLTHIVLLVGTVLFPLSGVMMSVMGGNGLSLFGLELIANNPNPAMPGRNMPINGELAQMARQVHGLLLPVMGAAIVLHIAGAVKQHRAGTGVLLRMLGRRG